jgi:sigma-B regulation protein RsbU (phosphoserine phosphatase)
MKSSSEIRQLTIALLLGALALTAGVLLARRWLPEWQSQRLPEESFFVQRHQELARRLGLRLEPGKPRVRLSINEENLRMAGESVGGGRPEPLTALGAGLNVKVGREASQPGKETLWNLDSSFSPEGDPRVLEWTASGMEFVQVIFERSFAQPQEIERFASLLLAPGESLGKSRPTQYMGNPANLYPILGSEPPQHIRALTPQGGMIDVSRRPGAPEQAIARSRSIPWIRGFLGAIPGALVFLSTLGLFLVLAIRRRIDLINGAILGVVTFLASAVTAVTASGVQAVLGVLVPAALIGFWVFLVWSAGESLLRSADSSFTTSLDSLRAGRLGPRGGRALLYGLALGGVAAGLRLALLSSGMALPGAWPEESSLHLPVFSGTHTPLGDGISLAALVTLVLAFTRRFLAARWAMWAAVLAGALFIAPLQIHPDALQVTANLAVVGLLVFLARRFGLTALLTASVVSFLLPAAVFSALHLNWLPVTFGATAGLSAAFLVLGLVGLRQPEQVELQRLEPPAFMRRLEEERRIRYEMDLLARMQIGLLPAEIPQIEGWEIAARSLLATEAGGDLYDFLQDDAGHLWIAAGDVAGHGYSCSIVHAMTTAALSSLVAPGRSPAEVLREVNRVIRRGGTRRNFTSLALLRLDPATGEAVFANAGHPYPLAISGGEVSEIELPGLPLGQGPERRYQDVLLQVPPGGVLVFCSDGLFEAIDWSANPYGFDRPREVLRTLENRSAAEILDTLLADWQTHVKSEAPPDDTTILVVKRAGTSPAL